MIGIGLFVCLFIFLITVHADSGKRYQVDSLTLELRDAPNQNATVLTELNRDEKVTVFDESDGWGKTYYHGKKAWAAIDQLKAVNDTNMEQEDAEQSDTSSAKDKVSEEHVSDGQLYQVNAPAIHLREAPENNATIITELNNGEKVTIFGESDGWGKTFYNDKEAWVVLDFLDEDSESTDSEKSEINETDDSKDTTEETEKKESKAEMDLKDEEESDAKSDQNDDEKEKNQDDQMKQSANNPLIDYHFVIDPGHGGKDTGAIGSEVDEKN